MHYLSVMQINSQQFSEPLRKIRNELEQTQTISQSKAKQFLTKLIADVFNTKCRQKQIVRTYLQTLFEIEMKTYNLSSKIIPEVWKVLINLQFQLLTPKYKNSNLSENHEQHWTNLQDFYNAVLQSEFTIEQQIDPLLQLQDFEKILDVWNKSFSYSDIKTLQYAFLSLDLCWNLYTSLKCQKLKNIEESIICGMQKVSLNLIKFSQRIKESETFKNLVLLVEKMERQFYKRFQKQIQYEIQNIHESFRLSDTRSSSNIHVDIWQKIVFAKLICISKLMNGLKDVQKIMAYLQCLKRTYFFEKVINFVQSGRYLKFTCPTIISASELQHISFGILLDIWINIQVVYDGVFDNENDDAQKVKILRINLAKNKTDILEFIKILTKRELNIPMVRQLVKRLQIVKLNSVVSQWKQLFVVMHLLLKFYAKSHILIEFNQEKSYISKVFFPPLKFPFSVNLKVKGQSVPFKEQKILIQFSDSNAKQKIWITMRNYEKNCMIFSFVKLLKNNIFGKQQKEFRWNQYQANEIQIVLINNKIRLYINKDQGNALSMQNSLSKIDQIVLCDRQSGMGSTISQLFNFKIIQYNIFEENQKKQVDLVPFIDPRCPIKDTIKQNLKFHKCKKIQQHSFIYFVENLGDLELFMLILYHTLKKIKNEDILLQLTRMVLNLLQQFTLYKEVQHKQLTEDEKKQRRNSILCLSWFFAKQTKSVFIIFQLMRLLYIRGKRDNTELLKFLCNFSYWKDFKLEKQILLVMKIKQILKQSSKEEEKINNLIFCKKMLFDMVLYFKESHYLMAQKEICLKLHRTILETVYEQIQQIFQTPNKKVKTYMLQILSLIQFTINLVSCILNRKIHEEAFDITFAVEITLFLRDVSKLMFISKERKLITKAQIDSALQVHFKKDQKQLIVPLSLNPQQVCDQRFNLFLTKLMSLTKQLTVLFDTETFYFEDSQIKVYPLYSETSIFCNESKVHSNIISFNIYMSMLSEKSWNYILFGMPLVDYTQRFCQCIWRICFYELFKEKKYFLRICKMLEQTPLPHNQYCLMKIFQVVLFYSIFSKQYLYRILKSQNFSKSICPFKIQQLLIKYLNKLQPQICNTEIDEIDNSKKLKQKTSSLQDQKIYYVLLYSPNTDFQSCKDLIESLRYRNSYQNYKIILFQLFLKSLVKFSQQKINQRKQNASLSQSLIFPIKHNRFQMDIQSNIEGSVKQNQKIPENEMISKSIEFEKKQMPVIINQSLSAQMICLCIEALEFYLESITHNSIKEFFNIDSKEDIEAFRQNFVINVEGMVKALKNYQNLKSTYQFEKYLCFAEVYLKKFSIFLVKSKFPAFKLQDDAEIQKIEEKSKNGRNKFLYKTVHIDLIKNSSQFFVDQIKDRRAELHSLEQIWNNVQVKNKYFWNLFVSTNKYYSLSEISTDLGERLLLSISNDKPKIQLPKMINKQSMMCSVSLISDKIDPNDESQLSTLFDECQILKTQLDVSEEKKQKVRKGSTNITKEIKTKKFRVLMVTNNKFYQGLLFMSQKDTIRFQQTYPSQKLYQKIGATAQQRRDDDEIEKDPKCFDILLIPQTKVFFRKYLFFDAAIQIFSHEKVTFFCFDSDQKRNKFCSLYFKDQKVLTYQKMKKIILEESIKWSKGLISNYDYLMKVNQYANRSPNDLSQYYVMPWTIVEFQKKDIDKSYIFRFENFRDLRKPLGKAFDTKWKEIESRFKMSFGQSKLMVDSDCNFEPFMYGSFYSNPAIVTNYMIRLEPFSSLHYLLQSEKIDVADRLFFQFQDQYRSIKTNVSDIKELIPEFYNNPEFLKNRSKLNLGSRQNKEIVNDVRLPKWAQNAYEFVFKMKYFLQSPMITKSLSCWIDLIFGVNAKKQNALKADNLYMSEIYGPKEVFEKQKKTEQKKRFSRQQFAQSKNSSILQLQNRILFNKEFGQLPLTIFDEKHIPFDMIEEYYFFKGIVEILFVFSHSQIHSSMELNLLNNFCLLSSHKTLELIDTNATDFNQKQNYKLIFQAQLDYNVLNSKLVPGQNLGSLLPYLFYVKKTSRKICSRFIKKTKIFGSLQLKEEFEVVDGQTFNWINGEVLIIACGNALKIYSFEQCSINHNSGKVHLLKIQESKPAVSAKEFPIFTQHQAEICIVETNNDLKLIVSLDETNRLFILKYYPDKIQLINNFKIKNWHFEQKIIKIIVHKMSLIICLTNYQRLLTFNFYGDLIGSKEIGFKIEGIGKGIKQKVNCLTLFNKQSSELLIGTNLGNVWKVDLFQFYKTEQQISVKDLWFQKISINSKDIEHDIKDLKVKRYGRHWEIFTISTDQNQKRTISKIKSLTMKNLTPNLFK